MEHITIDERKRGNQDLLLELIADRCILALGEVDATPQMNQLMMSPYSQVMSVDT